jgi:hypothetical protein
MLAPVAAGNVAVAALPLYALLTPVGVGIDIDLQLIVVLTLPLHVPLWLLSFATFQYVVYVPAFV